jgi:hypothetical protein
MATLTTTTTPTNTGFPMRLLGALALDPMTYEEVEADKGATGQALLVVVLSSLAGGIGARGLGSGSLSSVVFLSCIALLSWATWAVITFEIGSRLMPEPETRVDVGELLRTIGFAATPGMLQIFGVVPGAALPAFAITWVWMLVATVVAVRQALDFKSTMRAVSVCALGWVLALAIALTLGLFFGPTVS